MSRDSTYCFLINCASNSFRAEGFFKQREAELSSLFPGADFVYIRKDDSIEDIAKDKATAFNYIVACGGDGTVNKVANGLIGTDTVLGVIPLGSGNDFAQSISLNGEFEQAIQSLKTNSLKKIDVIESDQGYILNTFGIGVDGVTNYFASKSRFRSGFLRYFVGGLRALATSRPFGISLKISGKDIRLPQKIWMAALANGKNEGGRYTISPDSDHADGIFEIVVVNPISRIRLIFEFIKLSFGIPFRDDVVRIYTSDKSAFIKTDHPQKVHSDGEQITPFQSGKFEIVPGAITVITGPNNS
ncbi:MAG: hypothetical protein CL666_06940 [Balneola sp.]|nr:hypothetical protein [Balneola sp.]